MTATVITGSLNTDSRVLDVVRVVKEVRGGGIGSEMMLYVVTISKLGMTSVVTSARSVESTEVEVARVDKMGNC